MIRATNIAVIVLLILTGNAAVQGEVVIETVTVGDPGNAGEPSGGGSVPSRICGAVGYVYNIGKYEVTNAQYAEFLNAVAVTDTYGLYNIMMDSGYGGIARTGSEGNYTYSTSVGRENMPVNYVSWYDALRFANWMHNGQGGGNTEDGAYDMSLGSSVVRKPNAQVFLPTEDEWYKAAYYKGGGTGAGYWDYPTETDDPNPPTAEGPPGTDMVNGSANYDWIVGLFDMTDVGAYTARPSNSAYGTFDQGGNVWEWNEADIHGDGSDRGLRGGAFNFEEVGLRASHRDLSYPTNEAFSLGFRVAKTSEPSPVCGNGMVEDGEECDDGATEDGDGCSATCVVEEGWNCSGEPSVCAPVVIPTVSEWGLVAMTLLVLTVGTVLFVRRRAAA